MKGIKKFLVASMCVAAMGAIVAPVMGEVFAGKATDNAPTWDSIALETEYLRDDTIVIPDRDVYVGGDAYDATIRLTYPDGATTFVSSGEMQLSEPGRYTLVYEGTDPNLTKSEVSFLVKDKLWSVSNPKSEVKFGKVGAASGLMVKLAKNDTLHFNKVIDLSTLGATEDLIRGFLNPETADTFECDKIVITLTDATDPTQTLTIRGNRSSTNHQKFGSYWTSAGPNQTLGGWDKNANGGAGAFVTTAVDGIRGTYGNNVSFYSCNGKFDKSPTGCSSWITTADMCQFYIYYDKDQVKTSINDVMIADHDNGENYETEPLWYGFPSNKVFVSVQTLECTGEAANFCIMNLFGYDKFTEENTQDISFVEKDAPEITVDVDEKYVLEQNGSYSMIPKAVYGANYPVPAASAYDLYSGDIKVETKVYHNYSSETGRTERAIRNGTFNVNKTGKYAIVYKATDAMGNVSEKIYWVEAVRNLDNPLNISIDTTDVQLAGVCGEKIAVAPYEATGGSGDKNVTITATCGETVLTVEKNSFIPEVEGTWTVEYVAKDYAGCIVSVEYEVVIARGTKPVFVEDPLLPRYIISGLTYNVPTVKANDYSNGYKEEIVADMIVVDGENNIRYKAGEEFKPTVKEGETTITLKFVAGDSEYVKTLPVISPFVISDRGGTLLYIERMFVAENLTATRTQNGLLMTAQEAGNAKWLYANAVVADKASINVKGIQGYSNFDTMKVTFTDYMDENVSVTMTVRNQKNGLIYAEFGDLSREMTKGFNLGKDANGNDLDTLSFSYNLGKFQVDKLAATVTVDDKGNAFDGFPSGRVYISVEIEGAKADAQYLVKKFDNHILGLATSDRTAPRVAIVGEYGGMHSLNKTYSVAPALASDTMDANISAVVTVRNPKGEVMRDVNGLLLENVPADRYYDIKLTEYGQYKVKYVAEDYTKTKGEIEHTINVFDAKAPTASLADTWSATAKVGETVVLPEIYVSDDSSSVEEMKVFRYVRNPFERTTIFGQDYTVNEFGQIKYYKYSFTFTREGEYTFINVVYDAAGNQKIVQYTVTVEA